MIISINRFYPGVKSGGPQTSVYNFCKFISNTYLIKPTVITLDRDVLDKNPYNFLSKGKILNYYEFEFSKVIYIHERFKFIYPFVLFFHLFRDRVLIVNSFFNPIFGLLIPRVLMFLLKIKVFCITRGELQRNSLNIKYKKKYLFIRCFNLFNLKEIDFVFSDGNELKDSKFASKVNIVKHSILPNLPQYMDHEIFYDKEKLPVFTLLYLGRIDEDKNLLFLLSSLKQIKRKIKVDIYGPIRNSVYWNKCLSVIHSFESNIEINYLGVLSRGQFPVLVPQYHFLINPSFSENYGHSISESLSLGLPVIVSLGTPWKSLEILGLGFNLDHKVSSWSDFISNYKLEDYLGKYNPHSVRNRYLNYPLIKDSIILNKRFIDRII